MSIGQLFRGANNNTDTRSAQPGQSGETIEGCSSNDPPSIAVR
jgi:hypothetical protein